MRRLSYISALLCAAALAGGCSNEELAENEAAAQQQDELSLVASTGISTRTTVGTDYAVNWTASDAFYAFGGSTGTDKVYKATATFELKEGQEGSTAGTFKGTVTGSKTDLEYAVYPKSAYTSATQTVTFPAAYAYPVSNAPMFGTLNADKSAVNFGQLLSGLMRVKVGGLESGVSGTLKLGATGITGSTELSISNGVATLGSLTSTGDEVTLSFATTSTDPILLDIPVPAGTYASGITATLTVGGASAETFKTTSSFEVKAGTVKVMPEINITEITGNTIKFSQSVASTEEATKALAEGVKNITIAEVKDGEEIAIPASSTAEAPVTINISSINGSSKEFSVKGADNGSTKAAIINAPEVSSGKVTVTNIEHVEISGGWDLVTAGTGPNTLEIKDGTVIKKLIITKGSVDIKSGAEVQEMELQADATIKNALNIAVEKEMKINVGTHNLTLEATGDYHRINGKLTLTSEAQTTEGGTNGVNGTNGTGEQKGTIEDKSFGLSLFHDAASLTMKNIDYTATSARANGIFIDSHHNNATITVENSTMTSKYYCLASNAATEVGSSCVVTLKNSKFTADETALLLNIPATLTATGCTFTGSWHGVFMRGGTGTFDGCGFNLKVTNYGASSKAAGATAWGSGNVAPSAALTIGNRGDNTIYNYIKGVTLSNSCTFSVANDKDSQTYPAIYIDANPGQTSQTVSFTYDDGSKTSFTQAGTGLDIRNTTGQVTVNNTVYSGPKAD